MTFVLAVTGWRGWPDAGYIARYLTMKEMVICTFHSGDILIRVGDCPTGVDAAVTSFCQANDRPLKTFRAPWDKYGKAAGPIRNRNMLLGQGISDLPLAEACPADLLLAFPQPGSYPYKNSGSWNCIGQAWGLGIRVELGASLGHGLTVNSLTHGPSSAEPEVG